MNAILKKAALKIFNAGLKAVDPEECINRYVSIEKNCLITGMFSHNLNKIKNIYLIGAGKASAVMASALETMLGNRIHGGVVITKYGHGKPLEHCILMEAGHPVPDENGLNASSALLKMVSNAGPEDLILCLISGGASSLTPALPSGITLADKQRLTRRLLACGAGIHEINTIRKHLSRIKGGQLCRHRKGARIISLIISDVIGNSMNIIGSGLTAPDNGSFGDCKKILSRYQLWDTVPESIRNRIKKGIAGQIADTPKPGNRAFRNVDNLIIGSLSDALSAAEIEAENQGFKPLVLTTEMHGEAREAAKVLSAIAREVRFSGRPVSPPACLLSGGETTVTIKGPGKGGRNMEFALAAAIELAGISSIQLLSAGSDGTDGPTDAAGAFADGSTIERGNSIGLSASKHLIENDSYPFFNLLGDILFTGPTRTNVMDLQIVIIDT